MSNPVEHIADLHIHTTISDGLYTPVQVVEAAKHLCLRAIAITDHDALDGVPLATEAAVGSDLLVISGVELSTEAQDYEIHILGYFIDPLDKELNLSLEKFREGRLERAREVLVKLGALGLPLQWERVLALAGEGALGRPHIAAAMIEAGYVPSIQEAFSQYLGRGQAAFVPRYKVSPEAAIKAIRKAQGLAVLAHPWYAQHLVPALVPVGLDGLEVYYTGYTPDMSASLARLARQNGLLATGGSDFHGLERLPNALGGVALPSACLAELLARRPAALP